MKTEINTSSIDKHYFNTEQIKAPAIIFHVYITEDILFLSNHKSHISQKRVKMKQNFIKGKKYNNIITSNFCSLMTAMLTACIIREKEISEPRLSQYQPQPRGKTIKMEGRRLADDICTRAKQSQRK